MNWSKLEQLNMLPHCLPSNEKEEERYNQKLKQRQNIWTMNPICLDKKAICFSV